MYAGTDWCFDCTREAATCAPGAGVRWVRSERMLMEQMRYNLLFHSFVTLAILDALRDYWLYSKNRDGPLEHEVVEVVFTEIKSLADKRGLPKENSWVDGTLVQA